jgi:hypothetical protein
MKAVPRHRFRDVIATGRRDVSRCDKMRSTPRRRLRALTPRMVLMQNHVQQRAVNLQAAVVFDEPKLTKLVHERADARARGADHLGQHLLADRRNDRFRFFVFAEVRKQQKQARKTLFARIEKLIDKVGFDADVTREKMPVNSSENSGLS